MTQQCREAIIELLFLSLYLDNKLSLAEDEVLTEALDTLGWESETPREAFISTAFAAAREVADVPETTADFMGGRARTIQEAGEEGTAMTWLSRVLGSDGVSGTERYFMDQLQARFYPDEPV